MAADVAVHAPHRHGDERNWHAHVLTTTRVVEASGLGAKTRELDVLQTSGPAVEALRELWAVQVNHALERIRSEARVDHRSYVRRGEDQVATQHLGPAAAGMERRAARQAWGQAEASQAVPAPVTAARLVLALEVIQDGPERARALPELGVAPGARGGPAVLGMASWPSAGVSGAGSEPVTRIGRRNAEIQERNQVMQAARAALEAARRALDGLERAAERTGRRMAGLVRGLGARIAGELEERARAAELARQEQARQATERQAEREREATVQQAERDRIAAELARPAPTQAQRDAARTEQAWNVVEEAGRRARAAERARQEQDREVSRPRQGPSMGR